MFSAQAQGSVTNSTHASSTSLTSDTGLNMALYGVTEASVGSDVSGDMVPIVSGSLVGAIVCVVMVIVVCSWCVKYKRDKSISYGESWFSGYLSS